MDKTYDEMRSKSLFFAGSDRFLFTAKAGDVATEVHTVGEDATIQEAAQLMAKDKISSLIVLDKRNLPAGIVTDKDLREKVVAKGRSVSEPVKNIMTLSLIRVDAGDSCFEAVMKMIKYNIHHMLVIEEGAMKGIMTNHDLMLLQGTSPLSFVHDIENQQTMEGLVPVSKKINNIIGLLLKEGAKASNITKAITEINDRLMKKILEIGERVCDIRLFPIAGLCLEAKAGRNRPSRPTRTTRLFMRIRQHPKRKKRAGDIFRPSPLL